MTEGRNRTDLPGFPAARLNHLRILIRNDTSVIIRLREKLGGQCVLRRLLWNRIRRHQRIAECGHTIRIDLSACIGRINAIRGKSLERNRSGINFVRSILGQVQTRNPVMFGNLFADLNVGGNLPCLVILKHLRRQRVNQDAAVRRAIERDLTDKTFQRGLDLFNVRSSVIRGKVQNRQMPAANHFTKHRLSAAAPIKTEPTATGIHVTRLVHPCLGKIFLEPLHHLRRIAKRLILQPRPRQDRIPDKEEILIANLVILEIILAVWNAAPDLIILRRRRCPRNNGHTKHHASQHS